MSNQTGVRLLLLVVIIVGAIGTVGLPGTVSYFSDTTSASGVISATDEPTADAGGDYSTQDIFFGEAVRLDGSNSTGAGLEYSWEVVDGSGIIISGGDTPEPRYWTIYSEGEATVRLNVTDDHGWWDTDEATIHIGGSSGSGGGNTAGTAGQQRPETVPQPTETPTLEPNTTGATPSQPTPTPTASPEPSNTSTVTPTPTPTEPAETPTATPEPTVTPTSTAIPTPTPEPTGTPMSTETGTPSPTATATADPTDDG